MIWLSTNPRGGIPGNVTSIQFNCCRHEWAADWTPTPSQAPTCRCRHVLHLLVSHPSGCFRLLPFPQHPFPTLARLLTTSPSRPSLRRQSHGTISLGADRWGVNWSDRWTEVWHKNGLSAYDWLMSIAAATIMVGRIVPEVHSCKPRTSNTACDFHIRMMPPGQTDNIF